MVVSAVAPDAIYSHVKSCREEAKNLHYIAPENAGKFSGYVQGDLR
jgi:hypothetical protein